MIDTNKHVNNGQYINMAMALFEQDEPEPAAHPVKRMLAEYKKSAVMGDTFCPYTGRHDGRYYVCLKDGDDNINAIVVFEQ
jgi:acyl-ACP thioesterase